MDELEGSRYMMEAHRLLEDLTPLFSAMQYAIDDANYEAVPELEESIRRYLAHALYDFVQKERKEKTR